MKVLDLFAGIGGFSLGLEKAGMETVAFCEYDENARKVLNKHWPEVPVYNDVRDLTNERLKTDGIDRIDVITGGFPCQDISVAGNQAGISSETRSGLWSECARLLGDIRPKYAIFENVTALLNGAGGDWFKRVLWDISEVGYDAEWHCIPASEFGAHHHRDRIWIICYPNSERLEKREPPAQSSQAIEFGRRHYQHASDSDSVGPVFSVESRIVDQERQKSDDKSTKGCGQVPGRNEVPPNSNSVRQQRSRKLKQSIFATSNKEGQANSAVTMSSDFWKAESSICRVADGVPRRAHRLKQLGNAVVPQIPEAIGQAIMEQDKWQT